MVARQITDSEKTGWVVALMTLWVLLGLVGHDPWKPDEAYTFGIVWQMLQHGQWAIPTLAGERYEELSPLFYWVAALFAKLFGGLISTHDAARLASGAFVGAALWCVGVTSRLLFGKGTGRYAVLTLTGCLGLLDRAHLLIVDNGVFFAVALALLGCAYLGLNAWKTGAFIGFGAVVAWMSKGYGGLWLVVALCAAYVLHPISKKYSRQTALFCAAGIVIFCGALWIWMVARAAPGAFTQWTRESFDSVVNIQRSPLEPLKFAVQYFGNLLWFAFPAWPLALWSSRLMQRGFVGGLSQRGFVLPAVALIAMFIAISILDERRTVNLMPLTIPLALLAVPGLNHLKRGHSGFIDWVGIVFFGLILLFAWAYWSALYFGYPTGLRKSQNNFQPGFTESLHGFATLLAFALTVVWFAIIRPARRTHKRALVNWTMGLTAVWGVVMLLGMPYLDYGKSFRIPINAMRERLPQEVRDGTQCLASAGLGMGQRAMLDYMANLRTTRIENNNDHRCNWLLVQANQDNPTKVNLSTLEWEYMWRGLRPGGKEEPWDLYRRIQPK